MSNLEDILAQAGIDSGDNDCGSLSMIQETPVRVSLRQARIEVEEIMGKVPLFGRYHRQPRVLSNDYEMFTDTLGSGFNGAIKLATSRHRPGLKFAVKHFDLTDLSDAKAQVLKGEVMAFLCMDHPHIARLVDVFEATKYLSLVMECMEGGELSDRVGEHQTMPEAEAADVIRQVLLALNYLHCRGIVHRDIKHGNVMFEKKGGRHIKLIDFGFTKFRKTKDRMHTTCGTLAYMAPEVLGTVGYTSLCDLWSVGVILHQLLTGQMPFDNGPPREDAKVEFPLLENVSPAAREFALGLLEIDPGNRMSAASALDHHWITGASLRFVELDLSSRVHCLERFARTTEARRICMLMAAWSLSTDECESVRDYFVAMDTRKEGVITEDDLEALKVQEVDRVLSGCSQTGEGNIHFSEFLAAMLSSALEPHDELLLAAFHRFDLDEAECITAESLRQVLGDSHSGMPVEDLVKDMSSGTGDSVNFSKFASFVRGTRQKPTESGPKCCALQ